MEQTNDRKIIVQRLKKSLEDNFMLAQKYYRILSDVNDLRLTDREIQLLAFAAIKGNISYASNREEFCTRFNSSGATINNMISKMKKMKIFVKDGSKVKVNPVILLNFDHDLSLEIKLLHGQTKIDAS
jgi:hypothetical protein